MKLFFKKPVQLILPFVFTSVICIFLFTNPALSAEGVRRGIRLCTEIIIPSLFPFMIVSAFVLKSGVGAVIGKFLNPLTQFLFALPGEAGTAVFMSMIGGFPIGAKMTAELLENGSVTSRQAQRMQLFCLNAGPAFMVGALGNSMLGNSKVGWILYASNVLSSVLLGVLTRIVDDKQRPLPAVTSWYKVVNPVTAFSSSTAEAAQSIFSVCAWVIVFNTICMGLSAVPMNRHTLILLKCLLEATQGCEAAAGTFPVPALAAVTAFAGLSVHCQIFSFVQKSGLKAIHFYAARLLAAGLSACICMGLLKLFPQGTEVFGPIQGITPNIYSVSLPAAVALLMMSILFIFEVDTKQKIC